MPGSILHHNFVCWFEMMAVNACLQALVKFEGCQAILQKGLSEAEAAIPNPEMQAKLQEVPSSGPSYMTSIDL